MSGTMSAGELGLLLAVVIIASVIKAIAGMGLPLIVIPVASLFVDVADAVVVIALPNLLANGALAYGERSSRHEARDLPMLTATGLVGAIVGTVLFVNLPEEPLVIALVVAVIGYIAIFFLKPEARTTAAQSKRWAPLVGSTAGAFQGAIGISGPIVGSWIHSYRLARSAHIFSVSVLFLVAGVAQFAVLVATGELSGRLAATLLACVPVLASIPVGTWLRSRVSARGFDLAIVGMLGASAIALCLRTFLSLP